MHRIQFDQILRDVDVVHAISPIVREYRLSEDQIEQALLQLHIPRAADIAAITHRAFPAQPLLCN